METPQKVEEKIQTHSPGTSVPSLLDIFKKHYASELSTIAPIDKLSIEKKESLRARHMAFSIISVIQELQLKDDLKCRFLTRRDLASDNSIDGKQLSLFGRIFGLIVDLKNGLSIYFDVCSANGTYLYHREDKKKPVLNFLQFEMLNNLSTTISDHFVNPELHKEYIEPNAYAELLASSGEDTETYIRSSDEQEEQQLSNNNDDAVTNKNDPALKPKQKKAQTSTPVQPSLDFAYLNGVSHLEYKKDHLPPFIILPPDGFGLMVKTEQNDKEKNARSNKYELIKWVDETFIDKSLPSQLLAEAQNRQHFGLNKKVLLKNQEDKIGQSREHPEKRKITKEDSETGNDNDTAAPSSKRVFVK